MITACLADAGLEPEQAVIVGDTTFDMEMGRAAGLKTIGVSWGYQARDGLSEADVIVDTPSQLHSELSRWKESLT